MIDKLISGYVHQTASDEELVILFLESGDNRHFEKLYERYAHKVFQTCYSLTKDECLAEDLMHDIFIKLISKLNTFKKDAKFSTWLFAITYNHCMDLMRSCKRKIVVVHEENADMADDFDMNRIFDIDRVDKYCLKTAIAQLDTEDKALLYLKYLENRTGREISEIFMLTESTIKMRLLRARRRLREKYLETFRPV